MTDIIDPGSLIPENNDWQARLSAEALEVLRDKGEEKGLAEATGVFYERQRAEWPGLERAVKALDETSVRRIQAGGSQVILQYNPARLANATAPVAPEKIASRPCPLCPQNMYPGQKALPFLGGGWLAVCNPMPIFPNHLVAVSKDHSPQTLKGAPTLRAMLYFTAYSGLTTLYNGPRSGASIPDHLHFQAAPPGLIPLERELSQPAASSSSRIMARPGIPPRIYLTADSIPETEKLFSRTIKVLNRVSGLEPGAEPELNLVVFFRGPRESPVVVIHPRARHRPSCYYLEGREKILVSPGASDMAGLVIVPRREDFEKLDGRMMRTIYKEVSLSREDFDKFCEEIDE